MAKFHPSDNELMEFAAGNLEWALGICVSAHVQLCTRCKNKIKELEGVGGAMLKNSSPSEVSPDSFSKLMSRIRCEEKVAHPIDVAKTDMSKPTEKRNFAIDDPRLSARIQHLPDVVKKLLPKDGALKWSYVSPSLRAAKLTTGQDKYEVSFHKIKRGGRVADHDHNGLEVTLVLEGSFSDSDGQYEVGDYVVKRPGEAHRPMAAQDQDCLCLTVIEAPVKVRGLIGKVVNPFLTIDPR